MTEATRYGKHMPMHYRLVMSSILPWVQRRERKQLEARLALWEEAYRRGHADGVADEYDRVGQVCINPRCMAEAGGCINDGGPTCYLTYRDQDQNQNQAWCQTCLVTNLERHPNRPGVVRCANCKEWLVMHGKVIDHG